MTGQTSFGTGDINLAASLITLGIPPDATEPVRLIACENGKDYTRFHVGHLSYCGKYQTAAMMAGWSDPVTFKLWGPNHPLNVLMGFITARPRGCSNLDQWLEHASEFLKMPMDVVRSNFKSITKTCQASPECPSSYVLAFVRNRIEKYDEPRQGVFYNSGKSSKTHSRFPTFALKIRLYETTKSTARKRLGCSQGTQKIHPLSSIVLAVGLASRCAQKPGALRRRNNDERRWRTLFCLYRPKH